MDGILIASDLRVNKVLTSLNLASNRLGPRGVAAIRNELKSDASALTSLNLGNDAGA